MKKLLLVSFFFCSIAAFNQEIEKENLIRLDSTWGKEIFPFPIRFAQNINYTGVAEVRFPPKGWIHPEHLFFWTYTYVWAINFDEKITSKQLTSDLEKYFDGLNDVRKDNNINQKATATIRKNSKNKSTILFEGKVDTYDHFATNKRIILNVKIESNFYNKEKKTVILFKFSPKEFTHKIWKTMDEIELVKEFCNK